MHVAHTLQNISFLISEIFRLICVTTWKKPIGSTKLVCQTYNFLDAIISIKYVCVCVCVCVRARVRVCVCVCIYTQDPLGQVVQSASKKRVLPLMYFEFLII